MKGSRHIFFMPEKERAPMPGTDVCGDFMPFYHEGVYYLFYLYKFCIYYTTTKDFVSYTDPEPALICGSPEDQHWHIGTGSVIHRDGVFHFYFSAFNEGHKDIEGKFEQVLMRATSTDLRSWTFDPDFFVTPDVEHYGNLHWRDPHAFWNEEAGCYWLAVTATEKDELLHRSSCTHIMTSPDLNEWTHSKKLYAPRMFDSQECHDFFKIGDKWYMIFSNLTRWWETRYRMADSPDGPWITPSFDDMFDGRAFYAAKTVTDGERHYLVGWQGIRMNMDDNAKYQWGGSVLVHELVQRPDGTLGVMPVPAVEQSFDRPLVLDPKVHLGEWSGTTRITGIERYGFGWQELVQLPEHALLQVDVDWKPGTSAFGWMLHTGGDKLEQWCQVRIEPERGRLLFDRSNKFHDDYHYIEERPISLKAGEPVRIKVIISGNIVVAYANDVALAARAYNFPTGGAGLFIENGEAVFTNLEIRGNAEATL